MAVQTSGSGDQLRAGEAGQVTAGVRPAPAGSHFAASLKDAFISGVVALALAGPIVGLQTTAGSGNRLALAQHWDTVAIIVGVVFVGRLLLNLFVFQRPGHVARPAWSWTWVRDNIGGRPFAVSGNQVRIVVGWLALVLAVMLPFMPFANRYVIDQSIVVLNYAMLGWGLNIVVGLAGLLDLGYVAFYAVGAYSFALAAEHFGLGFWACLPLAGILASLWGVILGFPVLRLRGDYLAIVTLAFGEIIRIVLRNWDEFTGGPNGLLNIPRPSLFGITFDREPGGFADVFGLTYSPLHRIIFLYYIILALAMLTNVFSLRMRRLPIGRAWEALREDEIACRSLGINTTNTKLTAFACGAMFGGFAGSFFATRQGFVSPESFTAIESFIILAVVVLGGLGSQLGIVIAVIFLNTAFEVLRELQEYRMLIVGLSMVLIMVWRPRGLISTRQPSIFLKERRPVPTDLAREGSG